MAFTISPPFENFPDVDGKPLENGYIYVGVENLDPQTNPVQVYLDEALTIPFAQPIRTKGGFPVNAGAIVSVYAAAKYSIRVLNKNGAQVYQDLSFGGGSGGGSALDISFTQAGTGADTQPVQTKLRQYLAANDYSGVDPTGVSDSTIGLKAVFDYAIPLGKPVELEGSYRITGPIQPYASAIASGGLHIVVKGKCSITVDAASTGFSDILYFHTTAFNSCSIVGGELNINGNNKAARGITIRHDDGSGGDVLIEAKLKLTNFLETNAAATRENSALEVYGLYGSVRIDSPYVYSVNRTNPTLGACGGVAVGNCSGNVHIVNPWIELVRAGPGAVQDADGIKLFGANPSVATEEYVGTVLVEGGNFVNNQGRSAKIRATSAIFTSPRVRRTSAVVAIPQGVEFDFQACANASLIDPTYEYFGTDTVAPFGPGSSFSCVAFQHTLTNLVSSARALGGKIVSNVSFPRYGAVVVSSGAQRSLAEFSGVKAIPAGSLTGTMLTRGIVEFDASLVASKAANTEIIVNGNEFPLNNVSVLTYAGLGSPTNIPQFSWSVCNNASSINSTYGRVLRNISGSAIQGMGDFSVYGNQRIRSLGPFTHFAFTQIAPGSAFMVDLAVTLSITNAPAWGTVGYALVEALDSWDSGSLTSIRATVNLGEKGSEYFYSYNAGGTWNTDCLPAFSAANIAAIGSTVNTRNKLTGLPVWDSDNRRVMVSEGTATNARWWVADGSASVTPV